MLIYMQKPDATVVAGFNKWRDQFGRNVLKGEKGIKIIAPTPFKKKIEQEKRDPDTNLPMLDADGKVTAVGEGTATVTATTADGKTATATVTVSTGATTDPNETGLTADTAFHLFAVNGAFSLFQRITCFKYRDLQIRIFFAQFVGRKNSARTGPHNNDIVFHICPRFYRNRRI